MVEDISKELMRMRDKILKQIKEKNNEIREKTTERDALKEDLADIIKMQKRRDKVNKNSEQKEVGDLGDSDFEPIVDRSSAREVVRKLFTDNPSKYFIAEDIADFLEEMSGKGIITIQTDYKTAAYNTLQKLGAKGFIDKKVENNKTKYRKKQ